MKIYNKISKEIWVLVILIGGCSCTGKTNLSQRLLEIYKIPYFSIDYLKMGLYRSGMDFNFTPNDSDEFIAEKLWPIIKGMIMTYIENEQNIIIEGCYLFPNYIKALPKSYKDNILSIFLGFSKKYIMNNYDVGIVGKRCIIEKRSYEEDRTKEEFIKMHDKFRNKCELEDAKYLEIDYDYETELELIMEYINKKLFMW